MRQLHRKARFHFSKPRTEKLPRTMGDRHNRGLNSSLSDRKPSAPAFELRRYSLLVYHKLFMVPDINVE